MIRSQDHPRQTGKRGTWCKIHQLQFSLYLHQPKYTLWKRLFPDLNPPRTWIMLNFVAAPCCAHQSTKNLLNILIVSGEILHRELNRSKEEQP